MPFSLVLISLDMLSYIICHTLKFKMEYKCTCYRVIIYEHYLKNQKYLVYSFLSQRISKTAWGVGIVGSLKVKF